MSLDASAVAEPLILTLQMDDASQERFDRLRRLHFPPERNFLRAHVTLFHKLPGEQAPRIVEDLEDVSREQRPVTLRVSGLRFLGKGVAYDIVSPDLEALRQDLAERWTPWLGPQDRQRIKPHITVQNKVPPGEARRLHEELSAGFSPFEVVGEGLLLWRYLGGPWEPVEEFPFGGAHGRQARLSRPG